MNRWLVFVVLAWMPVLALGQSLRCGDKIISHGSTRAELARLCGNPADVEHKTIYNDQSVGDSNVAASTTVEVHVEVWTYNFGPNRLMQRVWLEDGVVVRIESLGYGS